MRFHLKSRAGRALAAASLATVGASGIFAGLATTTAVAQADPKQQTALVIVGSDTTQEVSNALAGENAGLQYTPIRSSADSGRRQIQSFDALNPEQGGDQCITPLIKSATVYRPNGSSSGVRALSRAIDGATTWGNGQVACPSTGKSVAGLFDIARSSGSGSGTGTALTYVPFTRGALSFAYYFAGTGTAVTSLTRAELQSIFTSGADYTDIVRGSQTTRVYACDIQSGSGTGATWATSVGYTRETPANVTAYSVCKNTAAGADYANSPSGALTGTNAGKMQENDTYGLKAKGVAIKALPANASANIQVIVGMESANFIAQANGVSFRDVASGVLIGGISDDGSSNNLGLPYGNGTTVWDGTSQILPNSTFFNNATFGRTMYNVFDSGRVADADIESLFIGSSSVLCSDANALSIVATFGFSPLSSGCGSISLTRPLSSGTS
jgi:hypothetical protein